MSPQHQQQELSVPSRTAFYIFPSLINTPAEWQKATSKVFLCRVYTRGHPHSPSSLDTHTRIPHMMWVLVTCKYVYYIEKIHGKMQHNSLISILLYLTQELQCNSDAICIHVRLYVQIAWKLSAEEVWGSTIQLARIGYSPPKCIWIFKKALPMLF